MILKYNMNIYTKFKNFILNMSTQIFNNNPPLNFKIKKCITSNSHINLLYSHIVANIDDTFAFFKSINNKYYVIYSGSEDYKIFSLFCYDLINGQNITKIAKAHEDRIYTCRHFLDKNSNSDLLITSSFDKYIKIWNLTDQYKLIYKKKPDYDYKENTYLLSENLLFYNKKNYLITSAYEIDSEGYEILFYDIGLENKNKQKLKQLDYQKINDSKDNTNILSIYYEKNNDNFIPYILAGNYGNVKIFDFSTKSLLHTYNDNNKLINYLSIIINVNKNNDKNVIATGADGYLRIWDFNNNNLIHKIFCGKEKWLIGLCQLNSQYILAACADGNLKEFDLFSNTFVKSLNGDNNDIIGDEDKLYSVKKYEIEGKIYLLTHSKKGNIQLWENEV